jgi:hypothetical protein
MGEGLEKGANLAGGMYLKGTIDAEHQRMLQEATAEREARNIALTGTEARKTEAAKGTVVAPGSTLHREGQTDFQAPDTKHPQELLDFWKSEAEKNRAMARASDRKPDKEATRTPTPSALSYLRSPVRRRNTTGYSRTSLPFKGNLPA